MADQQLMEGVKSWQAGAQRVAGSFGEKGTRHPKGPTSGCFCLFF